MPPKAQFTAERAQALGNLAASNATDALGNSLAALQLTCTYRGTVDAEGHADLAGHIAARSTLEYEWRCVGEGIVETHGTRVYCNNASTQGVPFPNSWTTALKCRDLSSLIGQATEAAQKEADATDIECKFLGVPTETSLSENQIHRPGEILMLEGGETRMAHILCAWVRGSEWWCHKGTLDANGNLDTSNPFDERSLAPP